MPSIPFLDGWPRPQVPASVSLVFPARTRFPQRGQTRSPAGTVASQRGQVRGKASAAGASLMALRAATMAAATPTATTARRSGTPPTAALRNGRRQIRGDENQPHEGRSRGQSIIGPAYCVSRRRAAAAFFPGRLPPTRQAINEAASMTRPAAGKSQMSGEVCVVRAIQCAANKMTSEKEQKPPLAASRHRPARALAPCSSRFVLRFLRIRLCLSRAALPHRRPRTKSDATFTSNTPPMSGKNHGARHGDGEILPCAQKKRGKGRSRYTTARLSAPDGTCSPPSLPGFSVAASSRPVLLRRRARDPSCNTSRGPSRPARPRSRTTARPWR